MKARIAQIMIAFSVVGAIGLFVAGTNPSSQRARGSDQLTLREQAERTGGNVIVKDSSYNHASYNNVKTLVQDSATILTGVVLSNECVLTADGMNVNTNYRVRIDEVLKGTGKRGQMIAVNSPGGLKVFTNTTYAVVQIPDFRPPRNGRRYAFFLDAGSVAGTFKMTAGFQGSFELPTDGSVVKSSDRRTEKASSGNLRGRDVSSFLADLRASVIKH